MNNEICLCGHPNKRHKPDIRDERKYLNPCLHCSCKEFYAREEGFFGMPQEKLEKVMKKVIREANEEQVGMVEQSMKEKHKHSIGCRERCILDFNKKEPVDEWPNIGDKYYFISINGKSIQMAKWGKYSSIEDHESKRDFLGVYRTREEAEAVRDKVREFVRNLNKK